jgi:hypothetical protein
VRDIAPIICLFLNVAGCQDLYPVGDGGLRGTSYTVANWIKRDFTWGFSPFNADKACFARLIADIVTRVNGWRELVDDV